MNPRKPRVTSVDVAHKAGVSQSAVSRALTPGATGVSKELRARVRAAAKALGYRPNAHARSLISGRSRMVALLFPYLDNPFYAIALEKMCAALQASGYHALVFHEPDTTRENRTVAELLDYRVDGIITMSVELGSHITEECRAYGVPIVMFNRVKATPHLSSVTTDNVAGGRLAAEHLMSLRRERIAILAGWEGASTNRDREFGFSAELAFRGRNLFARAVGHFDLERTAEAVRDLFGPASVSDRPDALFVVNDYMAFRALSVLRSELGLRVPQNVAVMGFDDLPLAIAPEYDLTSIRQPIDQMVNHAIRILLAQIDKGKPEHVSLAPQLSVRGSTRGESAGLELHGVR